MIGPVVRMSVRCGVIEDPNGMLARMRREAQRERGWNICPNEPPCEHGSVLHDVEDMEDRTPRCCVEGCDCGRTEQETP